MPTKKELIDGLEPKVTKIRQRHDIAPTDDFRSRKSGIGEGEHNVLADDLIFGNFNTGAWNELDDPHIDVKLLTQVHGSLDVWL